jgi:CelD/BcsL family acetyltransferase involved in cellulose biosynthesis
LSCIAPCLHVDIRDQRALTELRAEWDALLQRSYDNRIFLTPTWLRIWFEHFGNRPPAILTLRGDEGELDAVLPLQFTTIDGEAALTLLGDHNVADYMDGAAVKADAVDLLKQLWSSALCELDWPRVRMRHVPSASPLIPAIQAVAAERGWESRVEQDEVSPVALLCSNWDGYLQMLSKKQRHEVRRKLRRAEEGVEWTWRTTRTPDELEQDLATFFELHEASAHEKARFMTGGMQHFFRALAREYLDAGILRLSLFRRDGVDVAATIAFLHRERYLLYNSGYDPKHSATSPGIVAIIHAMQDAIAERAVAFDFLTGDEQYKYQLGATDAFTVRVSVDRA